MLHLRRNDYDVSHIHRQVFAADIGHQSSFKQEKELLTLIVRFGMLSSRLAWAEPHDSCQTALRSFIVKCSVSLRFQHHFDAILFFVFEDIIGAGSFFNGQSMGDNIV
jgi:hypothetical protein